MWKLTSESTEDPDITELTDFVIVGSAKTGEDTEETQHEHSEGDSEDSDEDSETDLISDDYQAEDPTQWFNIHQAPGILFPRVQRAPHRPYTKSYVYYLSKSHTEEQRS